jgi:peptide/nickel transport system permease protein
MDGGKLAVPAEFSAGFTSKWVHIGGNVLRFARKKPLGAFGILVIVVLFLAALIGPELIKYDYQQVGVGPPLADPTAGHIFGTDQLGRDMFARMLYGARVTLFVGFGAVAIAIVLATMIGILSGYFGKTFDLVLQRVVDVWMAFPGLVLLIVLISIFRPGPTSVAIAIGVLLAGGPSRIVRAAVLTIKQEPFVEAARTIGASPPRIMLRHILPTVVPPLIVVASVQLGQAVLIEATISFLGYGIPPPYPSWGSMLSSDARTYLIAQPLLSLWPGVAITLVVFSFNMAGDALRDILDPRLRRVV